MKAITLTITNVDTLPDGGPLSYTSQGRAFEIGRDAQRDWQLPDPRLYISGRHCGITFDGNDYLLTDFSRNGTFVNGAQHRVKSPYRLQHGDKLAIGNYIITVAIEEAGAFALPQAAADPWGGGMPAAAQLEDDDIWGASSAGPKPMDRRDFRPKPKQPPVAADFAHSHLDLPEARAFADPFAPRVEPPAHGGIEVGPDPFAPVPSQPLADPGYRSPFPASPPPAAASPAPMPVARQGGGDMLSPFKLGARLPAHTLAGRNPQEVAQELGAMMHLIVEQVMLLLKARASAKAMVRTTDRTIIGALDNNPLKFMADPSEALETMLSKDRSGYLDGMRAFREAFEDIKTHEMATYSAMQKALARLLDDLSPEAITSKVERSTFSNTKAKAWETFVQRWEAKTEAHENGMLDVFLMYFSEAYQEASGKKRR